MQDGRNPNKPERPSEEVPELGRADISEIEKAPYSALGEVDDVATARHLVETLEEHGVPANAIELVGAETKDSPDPDTSHAVGESRAFRSLFRSVLAGGLVGLGVGGLLGTLAAFLIPGLVWPWGLLVGAIFGSAAGGVAGGMSVAKYASPAWDETYAIEESPELQVAVHHSDADVVDMAAEVMEPFVRGPVDRLGTRES